MLLVGDRGLCADKSNSASKAEMLKIKVIRFLTHESYDLKAYIHWLNWSV